VRPPESITEAEKVASMAAYGDAGSLGDYEYDHFVPLELGGATNDPRNLWPEPGAIPNPKDSVEYSLRERVCSGLMSLAAAQRAITRDWVKLAGGGSGTSPAGAGSKSRAARCSLRAVYSPSYHDYDVYVHSNQPGSAVTVSDAFGHSKTWHTDGSGYADVYFDAGGQAPGRRVTATVGRARCSGSL
jgi:hypothetical protein